MSTISNATSSIPDYLHRLNNGGVKVVGYDLGDKISVAYAASKLESGAKVPVRFANAEATFQMCDDSKQPVDSVVRPTDKQLEGTQTFQADKEQLRRMAAVVGRCDGELTEKERELKSSIAKLIAGGATFSLERFQYGQKIVTPRPILTVMPSWMRGVGERAVTANVRDSVTVAKQDDDAGLAMLMHSLSNGPSRTSDSREVFMTSGTTRHQVDSVAQMIAIAANLAG